MPLEIHCSQCEGKFRVPEKYAGKRVKCPKCQSTIAVSAAASTEGPSDADNGTNTPESALPQPKAREPSTSTPAREGWYMRSDEGKEYGPVTRQELDGWVAEGRIDTSCQVLGEGWEQWKWADEVFPKLTQGAAEPQFAAPDVAAAPENSPNVQADAGDAGGAPGGGFAMDDGSPPRFSVHTRHRQYPALLTTATIYTVLAWVVAGLGVLLAVLLGIGFLGGLALGGGMTTATVFGFLVFEGAVLLYTFLGFITLKAAAELIRLAINVEHDNHESADACRKMVQLLAEKK